MRYCVMQFYSLGNSCSPALITEFLEFTRPHCSELLAEFLLKKFIHIVILVHSILAHTVSFTQRNMCYASLHYAFYNSETFVYELCCYRVYCSQQLILTGSVCRGVKYADIDLCVFTLYKYKL